MIFCFAPASWAAAARTRTSPHPKGVMTLSFTTLERGARSCAVHWCRWRSTMHPLLRRHLTRLLEPDRLIPAYLRVAERR